MKDFSSFQRMPFPIRPIAVLSPPGRTRPSRFDNSEGVLIFYGFVGMGLCGVGSMKLTCLVLHPRLSSID